MTLADATVASMKKWKRKPSDFYATPYAATVGVVQVLDLRDGATVADPACGDGAISRVLEWLDFEVVSSDLRETGFGDQRDFLADDGYPWHLCDAIITNPPFSLAEEFIRKAVQQAPVVAMLLKSNYWNVASRLALWDEHTPTGHHPMTWRLAFLEEERGSSPLMDCDWWIWDRSKPPLDCRPLVRPVFDETQVPGPPLAVYYAKAAEAAEAVGALLKKAEELL